MRPFTSTIPFADALRIVTGAASPIRDIETVALWDADGRVAARDVVSAVDVPAFDRAAMDGYAVVAEDTRGADRDAPRTLRCVDRVFTGHVPARAIGPGECMEIATGAPLPAGADAVVMVEDTASRGTHEVLVLAGVTAGRNVSRRAADMSRGQVVTRAGDVMTPSRIGALAGTGVAALEVYRRPTVAIVSTGNEIAEPGSALAPGQVYNINRFTLGAVVRRHGGTPVPLSTAGDSLVDLTRAIDEGRRHDVLVFSGGSSVGARDLVLDVLRDRGTVLFHGVAVKPGKPTAFGRVGRSYVLGMPGSPASCLSNAYMLLVPLLRRLASLPEWTPAELDLPLARDVKSVKGRHQFYTVRVANGFAEPAFKASGDITSMADADGYIEIAADTELVSAGTRVRVRLF